MKAKLFSCILFLIILLFSKVNTGLSADSDMLSPKVCLSELSLFELFNNRLISSPIHDAVEISNIEIAVDHWNIFFVDESGKKEIFPYEDENAADIVYERLLLDVENFINNNKNSGVETIHKVLKKENRGDLPFWHNKTFCIVIKELMLNAVMAVREGSGKKGKIIVASGITGNDFFISITDNGKELVRELKQKPVYDEVAAHEIIWDVEDGDRIIVADKENGLSEEKSVKLFEQGFTTKLNEWGCNGYGLYYSRLFVENILGSISPKGQRAQLTVSDGEDALHQYSKTFKIIVPFKRGKSAQVNKTDSLGEQRVKPVYEYEDEKISKIILRNLFTGGLISLEPKRPFKRSELSGGNFKARFLIGSIGFLECEVLKGQKVLDLSNIQLKSDKDQGVGETVINWLFYFAKEHDLNARISTIRNPRIISIADRLLDDIYIESVAGKVPPVMEYIPIPIEKADLLGGYYDIKILGEIYHVMIKNAKIVYSDLPKGYSAFIDRRGYIDVFNNGKVLRDVEITFSGKIGFVQGAPNPVDMFLSEDGTIRHYQNGVLVRRLSSKGKTIYRSGEMEDTVWRKAIKFRNGMSREEERKYLFEALKNSSGQAKRSAVKGIRQYLRNSDTDVQDILLDILKTETDDWIIADTADTLGENLHPRVIAELEKILADPNEGITTICWAAYSLALLGRNDSGVKQLVYCGANSNDEIMSPAFKRLISKKNWQAQEVCISMKSVLYKRLPLTVQSI